MKKADAGTLIKRFLSITPGIMQSAIFVNNSFPISAVIKAVPVKPGTIFFRNFMTLKSECQAHFSNIPVSGIIFKKSAKAVELKVIPASGSNCIKNQHML